MPVNNRQSMRWLYAQGRPARGAMIRTAALGWASGLVAIIQAFFLSRVIHAVFIDARPLQHLTGAFAALAAAIVLRAALAWMRETSAFAAGETVRTQVRRLLLERITARGPASMRAERTGGLTSALMEQVEGLQDFYALYLPQLALVVLLPFTIAAVVLSLSWAAGGLLLLTAPLIPLFTVLVGMGAENISQRHFQALARLSAHFLDVLQGLATLKLFGRSQDEAERIARVSADFRRRTMSVLRVAFLSSAVLEFFASLSIALIAVYLGMSYLGYFGFGTYGRLLSLADGLFILLLAPEFYLPLRELGAHYHARAQALAASEQIRTLLEGPVRGVSAGTLRPEPAAGIHIQCRDVHVAYDGGRRPALQGVSLDLAPGCSSALVGGSGAGKSTLVFMLLGFLRPDRGQIIANGVSLEDIDLAWWQRQVGWIGQTPVIFHGTVRDNLRMGRPDAGDDEVAAAARASGVLDFTDRMPLGLDTPVGERGAGLSRGEAQRVALGRVFLKNAPVLLLDEPTAGVDPGTERVVLEAIESFRVGRTVLIVTHRLTDIHRADRIVVLEEGRIIEAGSPEQLAASGGPFQRLAGALRGGGAP
ncbi:MAG: thiol reductant ABC exporter subunit CydD [Hyphomicrobiales bacterium]